MPKIKFLANWRAEWQKDIPKGFIVLRYHDFYRGNLAKVLMKLDQFQNEKHTAVIEKGNGEPCEKEWLRDLEIEIEYHYKKRTLDQNALMWALYTIEADEQNGGMSGHKNQNVTPDELYLSDLDEYGERETINTGCANVGYYLAEYKIVEAVILEDGREISIQAYLRTSSNGEDRVTLRVVRGSSKFNTKEMARWIDRIFNRLAYNGVAVTNPGDIQKYWHDWREYLNENRITLHDEVMTRQEYKAFNPICEACGTALTDGTGELAHIRAIGMGGNNEPERNYSSNWLHLCAVKCHREIWHGKGVKAFLKSYKHLTYKVNTALSREYAEIPASPDLLINAQGDTQVDSERALPEMVPQNAATAILSEPVREFEAVCSVCGEFFNGKCPCGGLGYF